MPRQTAKERHAITLRFGRDSQSAKLERNNFERAFKKSGLSTRNDYLRKIVREAAQKEIKT
jgi:hypothetical protein